MKKKNKERILESKEIKRNKNNYQYIFLIVLILVGIFYMNVKRELKKEWVINHLKKVKIKSIMKLERELKEVFDFYATGSDPKNKMVNF